MLTLLAAGAPCVLPNAEREDDMTESVYKVIELIGTSKDSWEKAAQAAVDRAGKSLVRKLPSLFAAMAVIVFIGVLRMTRDRFEVHAV